MRFGAFQHKNYSSSNKLPPRITQQRRQSAIKRYGANAMNNRKQIGIEDALYSDRRISETYFLSAGKNVTSMCPEIEFNYLSSDACLYKVTLTSFV
jgi:hypothetical protein